MTKKNAGLTQNSLSLILRGLVILAAIMATNKLSSQPLVLLPNAILKSECEYYKDLSRELRCNDNNYLIKFAYNYCNKFEEEQYHYSNRGKKVLSYIRTCLIHSMDEVAQTPNEHSETGRALTCQNTEEVGFDSHVQCYIDSGFCQMSSHERLIIGYTVKTELLNPKMRDVRREIYRRCGL